MGNTPPSTVQPDKRNAPMRRRSIAWNFRYPMTTRRRSGQATMMVYNEKLSVSDWLDLLDLQQHEGSLQMYNRVEDILELTDNDLRDKGVRSSLHRSKMLSSLVGVKARRRQSMNIEEYAADSAILRTMAKRKNSCPPMYHSERILELNRKLEGSSTLGRKRSTLPSALSLFDEDVIETNSNEEIGSEGTKVLSMEGNGETNNSESAVPEPQLAVSSTEQYQEAIALKKALEWELSLETRDLRSHAWYHGPLSRQRAEEIVVREGDFLIRDCTSQPDNYVLTCQSKNTVLHFVINKIILQPETVYERIQYQFEEDAFDAIPDLITFYVGSEKPISQASGARIQRPCNRIYPLSFYGHKIMGNNLHSQMLSGAQYASPLTSPMSSVSSLRLGASAANSQPIATPQQSIQSASPMSSPPYSKRNTPPRLPSKKQRSQSLTPVQAMVVSNIQNSDGFSSFDGIDEQEEGASHDLQSPRPINGRRFSNFESCVRETPCQVLQSKIHINGFQTIARCSVSEPLEHVKFTTHSLPRPSMNFNGNRKLNLSSLAFHENGPLDENSPPSPPPKPNRALLLERERERELSLELQQQQQLQHQHALQRFAALTYQASGSDSGNGSGDSTQSSIPGDNGESLVTHRGVIIKNPRFMSNSVSSATLKSLSEFDADAVEEQLFSMQMPDFKPSSKFDIENFSTLLLPSVDNRPLDGDALSTFKVMLLENGPKIIAEHLTRIDVALLVEEPTADELPTDPDSNEPNDTELQNPLDCCGLEMLMLPQGKIFRNDLIERTQSLKLMVAVTILTCQTDLDRAELLSKWIQIAVETKTALGNLFGFCSIMLGLCMPQIQKLDEAWHILRQKYTDSAFTFEAKLRPTLISMNECMNPQAPNTTVPHVLLYALLIDRPVIDILSSINTNTTNENQYVPKSSLYTSCITPWETKSDDFGMSINYMHLDSARSFLKSLGLYRKNAKIALEESSTRVDELLSDAFRTEFHVKFLWGSKGASATADDRHSKLEKVLTMMTEKFCNTDNGAT